MITSRKSHHDHAISINPKVVRNINRALILNVVWEQQPISRARLAQITKLNKSTVSSIIAGLLEEELIFEEADRSTGVGRTPINLRMKTGKHFIGVAYFDSAATQLAIVDIDGTVKHCSEIVPAGEPPEVFVARCLDDLSQIRKRARLPRYRGIGIAVAGIVDAHQSRVVFAPNLGWEDLDLAAILLQHCPDVPVYAVQNDAKASALAELWFGRHELRLFNFVFLSVGRGIGTGLVVDKQVLNGDSHAAGEFGHMTIIEGGEPCSCGNRGCWEAYASDRATVQRYARARGIPSEQSSTMTLSNVLARASAGDDAAKEALEMTGYYLGLGIADIVLAVDPEAIIIGGPIINAWDLIYPKIMETVTTRAFFGRKRNTIILPSALRSPAPVLGAAAVSIRKIFTDLRVAL